MSRSLLRERRRRLSVALATTGVVLLALSAPLSMAASQAGSISLVGPPTRRQAGEGHRHVQGASGKAAKAAIKAPVAGSPTT